MDRISFTTRAKFPEFLLNFHSQSSRVKPITLALKFVILLGL